MKSGRKRRAITDLTFGQRILLLLSLFVVVVFVIGMMDPIPQDPEYHLFADNRTLFGIPNFNDVVSNIGFALVGVFGLLVVAGGGRGIFLDPSHARPYLFFSSVLPLSVWDRPTITGHLPMSACSGTVCRCRWASWRSARLSLPTG